MNIVFLGIGTNLGNRADNLSESIDMIGEYIGQVVDSSSVYETEPWGFETKDEFLNMVVMIETKHSPSTILRNIILIESLLGRIRGENRYSSRVIDIDLLIYEDQIINEKGLIVPHPLMHERKFVLIPLCEIAHEMMHPVLNVTFASLLESCKDKSYVRVYLK
jgi:dihydroneopterin aldolase/2-amino-4-hydroxy-6-hydroxymethyldihydropteridine diphosphokinase